MCNRNTFRTLRWVHFYLRTLTMIKLWYFADAHQLRIDEHICIYSRIFPHIRALFASFHICRIRMAIPNKYPQVHTSISTHKYTQDDTMHVHCGRVHVYNLTFFTCRSLAVVSPSHSSQMSYSCLGLGLDMTQGWGIQDGFAKSKIYLLKTSQNPSRVLLWYLKGKHVVYTNEL